MTFTLPEPYYADENVTLYCGDAREILSAFPDEAFAAVVTDPPYDKRTHQNARSNRGGGNRTLSGGSDVKFDHWDYAAHRWLFAELGRISQGWVVSTLASGTAFRFEVEEPPDGLNLLRVGAWIKTNPMPIISADRPAMGWEPIVYLHRSDRKPSWNGGGRSCNYVLPTSQGSGHPTQKPLGMVEHMVRNFTQPGDWLLDPFAGTGTSLRAALNEGRRAVGIEDDERWCEYTVRRLTQGVLQF